MFVPFLLCSELIHSYLQLIDDFNCDNPDACSEEAFTYELDNLANYVFRLAFESQSAQQRDIFGHFGVHNPTQFGNLDEGASFLFAYSVVNKSSNRCQMRWYTRYYW